jgi:hypothetical protein
MANLVKNTYLSPTPDNLSRNPLRSIKDGLEIDLPNQEKKERERLEKLQKRNAERGLSRNYRNIPLLHPMLPALALYKESNKIRNME